MTLSGVIRGPACETLSMYEQRVISGVSFPPQCYHFESKQGLCRSLLTHDHLLSHHWCVFWSATIHWWSLVGELRCGMPMKVQNKANKLTFGLRSWMNSQQHKIVKLQILTQCTVYFIMWPRNLKKSFTTYQSLFSPPARLINTTVHSREEKVGNSCSFSLIHHRPYLLPCQSVEGGKSH